MPIDEERLEQWRQAPRVIKPIVIDSTETTYENVAYYKQLAYDADVCLSLSMDYATWEQMVVDWTYENKWQWSDPYLAMDNVGHWVGITVKDWSAAEIEVQFFEIVNDIIEDRWQ